MEFTSTPTALPSFHSWVKDEVLFMPGEYPVVRIFTSAEWKTITPLTSDFKYNIKFRLEKDYEAALKDITKLRKKPIITLVSVTDAKNHKFVLNLAGAQEESPKKLVDKSWGYLVERWTGEQAG